MSCKDGYDQYAVDFHGNEAHKDDEFDPNKEGAISDPKNRHRDQVLENLCDTHPSAPECRVYDS